LKFCGGKHKAKKGSESQLKVEERLLEHKKKYEVNAELRKIERVKEEIGELREVP
jgi:hypothetical protein